jgi:putative Mg2+ transporter-C (MgtC) family protein
MDDALTITLRLLASVILGGIIGLEREWGKKPAGLRTHMLVSVGCTIFMLVSAYSPQLLGGRMTDPTRIAAQIVTGVGFLGAGSIIQARGAVYGLTTAASVWTVAGIGMAVGAGFYSVAVVGTLLAWAILGVVDRWEKAVAGHGKVLQLFVRARAAESLAQIPMVLDERGIKLMESDLKKEEDGGWRGRYRCVIPADAIHDLLQTLATLQGVDEVGLTR